MALQYHIEHDTRQPVESELYKGWALTKFFTCPLGEIDTYLNAANQLIKGRELPAAWGGNASGKSYEAMLQTAVPTRSTEGANWDIQTTWVSIDCTTADYPAGGSDYIELSRTRSDGLRPFARTVRTVAIALTSSDSSIPSRGDYLDGNRGDGSLNPVASSVQVLESLHAGRVFIVVDWIGSVKAQKPFDFT